MRRFRTTSFPQFLISLSIIIISQSAWADLFQRSHQLGAEQRHRLGVARAEQSFMASDQATEQKMAATARAFLGSLEARHSLVGQGAFETRRITNVSRHYCRRYQQTYRQALILGSDALICFDGQGNTEETASAICNADCIANIKPREEGMTDSQVLRAAVNEMRIVFDERGKQFGLPDVQGRVVHPIWFEVQDQEGLQGGYSILFETMLPYGRYTVIIDGTTAEMIAYQDHVLSVGGSGMVFFRDSTTTPDLKEVELKKLVSVDALKTREFEVLNEDGPEATEPEGKYVYSTESTHFDEVQAFYAMQYALEKYATWGFTPERSIPITVHFGTEYGNAFYDGERIALGDGDGSFLGNLARDNTILIHESGHWMVDDLSPIINYAYIGEGGALHEGYADYMACATYNIPYVGQGILLDPLVTYLRACNTDLPFSDRTGEVHGAGRVWSGAVWAARGKLGAELMDQIVVQSLQRIVPTGEHGSTIMNDAYRAVLSAAKVLLDEEKEEEVVESLTTIFERRGFES